MGLFSAILQPPSRPPQESRAWYDALLQIGFGSKARSGVSVTPTSALSLTAVWSCVRVIAESMAGLPLLTYRRLERGKERATRHPLYTILHDSPNPEMSAFELRELLAVQVESWGNGFANIEWGDNGQVRGLWPLISANMEEIRRMDGRLLYGYRLPSGELRWLPSHQVLHIRGMGGDGLWGYSPIRTHAEAIGLGLATEAYGAAFFGNGARPGGMLEHPGRLSKEAQERLMKSFADGHQGLDNAHRLKILEEGMKYTPVGIPPEEAQFLETRKFQVSEIARIYRIPPHLIGDLDRATFSNVEQQAIDFVVHSLRPRLVRFEQAIARQLMTPAERREYLVEHLVDGLLRGDIQSRYAAYNTGIQAGFVTRNEVRDLENWNPLAGLDKPLVPLNMVEAQRGNPLPSSPAAGEGLMEERGERRAQSVAADRRAIATAQEGILLDSMARIVRREANDIGRAVEKYLVRGSDLAGFLLWLDTFYQEHAGFIDRNLRPAFTALAALVVQSVNREIEGSLSPDALAGFLDDFVAALASRWAESNAQQLRAIIRENEAEPVEPLQERLAGWEESEAPKNARREAFRAVGAFAFAAYGVGRVARLRWVASGSENCPYCQSLNGRSVGYDQAFVGAGAYQPDGAASPLALRRQYKHAPLHDGCDCAVIAGG